MDNQARVRSGIRLLFAFLFAAGLMQLGTMRAHAGVFESGTGNSGDPYVITTAAQLNEIRNYPTKSFVLGADIDLSQSAYAAGWTPLPNFAGSLNGQGHTIAGVKITGTTYEQGFFKTIAAGGAVSDLTFAGGNVSNPGFSMTALVAGSNYGTISNVKVSNSTIAGGAFTAAIASTNLGTITGSQVIGGSVSGGQSVGGMAGSNSGTIEKSRVSGTNVTGTTEVGGAVADNQAAGRISSTSYVSSTNSLSVTSSNMGGLIGTNFGTVEKSYVESQVGQTGVSSIIGGLAGMNLGTITDTFAKADVRGSSTIGGLVGLQNPGYHLIRSYANGAIPTGAGGLIGQAAGEVSGSFWNTAMGGSAYGSTASTVTGTGAVGLTSSQLLQETIFTGAGWDFAATWDLAESAGSPTLAKNLAQLEVQVGGSPVSLDFYPDQYRYLLHVPGGTASVQVKATKAKATDAVTVGSGAEGELDRTVALTGEQTIIPVTVVRGSESSTYSVTVYKGPTPTGSVSIAGGAAAVKTTAVNLTISGTNAADMRFSADGSNWSGWESFAASKAYTLPSGDGLKTVYVQLRGSNGTINDAEISDTITLDTVAPAAPTFTVTMTGAHAASVAIEFPSDAEMKKYSLWGDNWVDYTGPISWGVNRNISAYAIDAAGNQTEAVLYYDGIDVTPPTVTAVINDGASLTNSRNVTLTMNDGATGAATMRLSDDGVDWTGWETYSASRAYTLAAGDGLKKVYMQFRDALANEGSAFYASITLDTTAPTITLDPYNGTTPTNQDITVAATPSDGTLNESSHTFTANGSFDFVATDAAGNSATLTVTITNIDKVAPTITLDPYNGTTPTNQDITVTATPSDGTLNASSHTFKSNGSFDFVATDEAGNSATLTVTITNIDKVAPEITLGTFNSSTPTNQDITVTATASEGSWTSQSHTFKSNGSFDFVATDEAGNSATLTVTITNIDKVAPVITIAPYPRLPANESIEVFATTNEGDLNVSRYTFEANGSFTFRAVDEAGNETTATVTIGTIDPAAPPRGQARINDLLGWIRSGSILPDWNGDDLFDREDVRLMLEELTSQAAAGAGSGAGGTVTSPTY
ncbi:beta strand repeat-containing protein [Paenibacillus cymbidii]|uniref:beta strand repeat-containing protein n=1 Tax=Paenibacillus cymbidii TaxID=1639034 RepID=UPI001436B768|nr:cadherin-like beta sandwich domain-containing protein [Paenibacillus cymbidii]